MGFKIPRAGRQVEDPSEVLTGQEVAPTAGTQAQIAAGSALQQAGRTVADVGGAVVSALDARRQALDKMAREAELNGAISADNDIKQSMVQFLAKEGAKTGLDTQDNIERFDAELLERTSELTVDLPDGAKVIVEQRQQNYRLKNRTNLAVQQQKEGKAVTLNNLTQVGAAIVQDTSNDPTVEGINDGVSFMSSTLNFYLNEGLISNKEAEVILEDVRQESITAAVTSLSLQDPEAAQVLLDEAKEALPSEARKSLETDIKKQAKDQKEAAIAQRDETALNFTNETIDLATEGFVSETQLKADPRWEILEPKEKTALLSIAKNSSPLNRSDSVTLAQLTTLVNTDPESLTIDDFIAFHGREDQGISTADFNRLFKQWQSNLKLLRNGTVSAQDSAVKQAYTVLNDAKTKRLYSDDVLQNELAWASSTQALNIFVADNPEAEPEDYTSFVENILTLPEKDFINRTFDLFRNEDKDIRFRSEAIRALTDAGVPVTENNIANIQDQMEARSGE